MKWLILCLFFQMIVYSYASDLPSDVQTEEINDFSGGLDTVKSLSKLDKNMSPNMSNVLIDEKQGSLVKRSGFTTCGSTSTLSQVNFLFPFNNENGNKEFLVSDSSIVLTTKDCQNYTLLQAGLNVNSRLNATQLRNKVWLTNGNDAVFTYDGTTVTVLDGTTYGTTKTPNVPRGKYIQSYLERIFVFNVNSNNSQLAFSNLTSTDGVLIAPDDSRAWPTTSALNIGQGDGTVGTALWKYRGQLQIGKEKSIYTLFGTDETNFYVTITDSKVGIVSNDSVVVLDNYTYFLAKDGIYHFDGSDSNRISDTIKNRILDITANGSRILSNVWETKSDFDKGTVYNSTSTSSNPDFINLITTSVIGTLGSFNPDLAINHVSPSSTAAYGFVPITVGSLPQNFEGSITTITLFYKNHVSNLINGDTLNSGQATNIKMIAVVGGKRLNQEARLTSTSLFANSGGRGELAATMTATVGFYASYADINKSSVAVKIEFDSSNCSCLSWSLSLSSPMIAGQSSIYFSTNSGQFVSDITTVTNITFWDSFQTIHNTNGGSVKFFVHAATDSVIIATQTWTPIVPGGLISFSTNTNVVQWASTMTSIDFNQIPNIDRVQINHNEGQSINAAPSAINWKNRYILTVTTVSAANSYFQYVKSLYTNQNHNAWMVWNGINTQRFGIFNEVLYGGGVTSGKILHLDYGTNDDGTAIDSFYETANLNLGTVYLDKNFIEYLVSGDFESGSTLKIGTSINGGAFKEELLNTNGSGIYGISVPNINTFGRFIRFRFRNNDLDKGLNLHAFGLLYQPTRIRTNATFR